MLGSIVELLAGLFLVALTLLIGSCIMGSVVSALRAVNRGSVGIREYERGPQVCVRSDFPRMIG